MSEKAGAEHYGEEIRETAEAKAERIVAQELRRRGWRATELIKQPKGDSEKVEIALRLRRETTMTTAWIAHRLEMGVRTYFSHLFYHGGRDKQ